MRGGLIANLSACHLALAGGHQHSGCSFHLRRQCFRQRLLHWWGEVRRDQGRWSQSVRQEGKSPGHFGIAFGTPRSTNPEQNKEGAIVVRASACTIIAHHTENVQTPNAAAVVEKLVDYINNPQ